MLPLAETTVATERLGTRHRAALGITEQTDALVVVVSEENGQISLVQRGRIVRDLDEQQLGRSPSRASLQPNDGRDRLRLAEHRARCRASASRLPSAGAGSSAAVIARRTPGDAVAGRCVRRAHQADAEAPRS